MKIAVVGAGIFGVTIAKKLAQYSYKVELFEKEKDILCCASFVNQYRIHVGYHYPRSEETVIGCIKAKENFYSEYYSAINKNTDQYYCISKMNSLMNSDDYLKFLQKLKLPFEIKNTAVVNNNSINLCVKVQEDLIDIEKLKQVCRKNLENKNIITNLQTEFKPEMIDDYDYVIIATYINNNNFVSEYNKNVYQYELCEKLIIELPKEYKNIGVVIMDGKFGCIDPLSGTDFHLMGHVDHAIYKRTYELIPNIPEEFKPILNNGIILKHKLPFTRFPNFIKSIKKYFINLDKAQHIGSMFTYRVVLPNFNNTDARPTLINKVSDKVITVFSGKIPTCVNAANEICNLIKR